MSEVGRPEGFDALPKRFRHYVQVMESLLSTLQGQVPAREPAAGARLKLVDRLCTGHDGFLSDASLFEYEVGEHLIRVRHAVGAHGLAGVELQSTTGALVVHPVVSNTLVVAPRDL